MTVHHADFAIPVAQNVTIRTSSGVAGRVIALGWWVDPDAATDADHEPTGTLYLVVDPNSPRPLWVPQGDLVETTLIDD
jgi:hypothetical protein